MSDGKPSIYLAGPMTGLTWRNALSWRKEAEAELSRYYRLINPVRAQVPEHRLDEVITASPRTAQDLPLHLTATAITTQDEYFIDQSAWILGYFLNAPRVSIGTVWELGYGWGTGKKILSVIEPGSEHDHGFIRRRSHIFTDNFEEALDFFKMIAL